MTTIEHRHLRSALEYAVLIAAEGQKRRSPISYPKELKAFSGVQRIPNSALGRLRRAIEGDPDFRAALSAGALSDLVDDVGRLWLAGASGWEAEAAEILAEQADVAATSDLRRELKRADKRRAAAEQATARLQVELLEHESVIADQSGQIDELRADLAKSQDALEEARAALIDARNEARHARDRAAAADERAEALAARTPRERDGRELGPAASVDQDVERAERVERVEREAADRMEMANRRLAEAARASREFLERIESLIVTDDALVPDGPTASERRPLSLPGGLISTSAEAARSLLGRGVPILVDGYNVAKLAWPDRALADQRDALVARCENLARRYGAAITVVFDGASVTGAHAPGRRSIRVVYSPSGTSADDLIRAEVERLPTEQAVVVVTNDREIIDDVRALGANVVPSNAFIAVL
jgi:hypothetical protein